MRITIWLCIFLYGALTSAQDQLFDDFGDRELLDCNPVCWTLMPVPGSYDVSTGDLVMSNGEFLAIWTTFGGQVSIRTQAVLHEQGRIRVFANSGESIGYWAHLVDADGMKKVVLWVYNTGATPRSDNIRLDEVLLPDEEIVGKEFVLQLDVHLDAAQVEVQFRIWRWREGEDLDNPIAVLHGTNGTYHSGITGVALPNPMGSEGATFRYIWMSHQRITGDPPRAAFSVAPGEAPLEVAFDASASTPPDGDCSYSWDFGDETDGDGVAVTHTYDEPGVYDVRLRFTDARGLTSATIVPVEPRPEPRFKRGDSNTDGALDISDAIFTLGYLFGSGNATSCLDAADANDDGAVDIADAIAVLSHLFAGAGDLPEPFGECGVDPTADDMSCHEYPFCG